MLLDFRKISFLGYFISIGCEDLVSYKISMGSRVKGYATPDSDDDYVLFVKSSRDTYLKYFTQLKILQNYTRKKGTAEEYTESDLLFGLKGVYNGTYPHLFVFGTTTNVPNRPLLEFIKEIGNLRLKLTLKHLVSFDFNSKTKKNVFVVKPKHQLQKLFNLSFVDYCLKHKRCPEIDADIALPALLSKEFKVVYDSLMLKRINGKDCSDEEIESIFNFQEKLRNQVLEMKEPDEYPDVLEKIVKYFL